MGQNMCIFFGHAVQFFFLNRIHNLLPSDCILQTELDLSTIAKDKNIYFEHNNKCGFYSFKSCDYSKEHLWNVLKIS